MIPWVDFDIADSILRVLEGWELGNKGLYKKYWSYKKSYNPPRPMASGRVEVAPCLCSLQPTVPRGRVTLPLPPPSRLGLGSCWLVGAARPVPGAARRVKAVPRCSKTAPRRLQDAPRCPKKAPRCPRSSETFQDVQFENRNAPSQLQAALGSHGDVLEL